MVNFLCPNFISPVHNCESIFWLSLSSEQEQGSLKLNKSFEKISNSTFFTPAKKRHFLVRVETSFWGGLQDVLKMVALISLHSSVQYNEIMLHCGCDIVFSLPTIYNFVNYAQDNANQSIWKIIFFFLPHIGAHFALITNLTNLRFLPLGPVRVEVVKGYVAGVGLDNPHVGVHLVINLSD